MNKPKLTLFGVVCVGRGEGELKGQILLIVFSAGQVIGLGATPSKGSGLFSPLGGFYIRLYCNN